MTDATGAPIRRGMKILLVASLALNVAVVGLVAGFWMRGGPSGGPRSIDMAIGQLSTTLPREDRRAMGEALRQDPSARGLSREDRRAFQEMLADAVAADPFDRAVLAEAIAGRRAQLQAVQTAASALLLDRIEAMSPEERAEYADAIRRFDGRGGRK